jgi:glyoxylase-like metal-dependent hydrolase (beta-lactamase superfamily II)
MNEVAAGVRQLALFPRHGVNAYVIGDVLVDTGMKGSAKKILKALDGHAMSTVVFTHAHVDHVGGAKQIGEQLGVEMLAGERDVEATESGRPVVPDSKVKAVISKIGGFDGVPVARALREGDEVAGFQVLDTPGHSPGHISLWRESDRTLICGDVWTNMNLFTTAVGLHRPPNPVTHDPQQNIASERRLTALEPETVLFGHGPPLTGAAPKLKAFMERVG